MVNSKFFFVSTHQNTFIECTIRSPAAVGPGVLDRLQGPITTAIKQPLSDVSEPETPQPTLGPSTFRAYTFGPCTFRAYTYDSIAIICTIKPVGLREWCELDLVEPGLFDRLRDAIRGAIGRPPERQIRIVLRMQKMTDEVNEVGIEICTIGYHTELSTLIDRSDAPLRMPPRATVSFNLLPGFMSVSGAHTPAILGFEGGETVKITYIDRQRG